MDDLIERALAEDVGAGDRTTEAVVAADASARARIVQKQPGVIAGLDTARAVFERVEPSLRFEALVEEGVWREEGPVAQLEGAARGIVTGERVALNGLRRRNARDGPGDRRIGRRLRERWRPHALRAGTGPVAHVGAAIGEKRPAD